MIKLSTQRFLCFLLILGLIIPRSYSQQDTTDKAQDSILAIQQDQSQALIHAADSIHLLDSLEQLRLQQQIEELRAQDQRKKAELVRRLDSLKEAKILRETKAKNRIDSLRANTKGVPVLLFDDTLFYIYSKIGPFSPSERAQSIEDKLTNLVKNQTYEPQQLGVFEGEDSYEIMHGDIFILSITNKDSFWLNQSKQSIAEEYSASIKSSIAEYQDRTGLINTVLRIVALILVVLIFYFMVKYLNRGFTRFNTWVKSRLQGYMAGIKIRDYEIITAQTEEDILNYALKLFKWIFILFVIYLSLPIIFSIFPTTEGVANRLISYVTDPLFSFIKAIVGYIPEMITIAVIATITYYFVRFLKFLSVQIETEKLELPGFYPDWARPTFNLLRFLLYAFAFVMIFPYLPGSDSPVFQGVSVFLGLLLSIGSSSAIGNVIAGLVITYMRPFKVGDRVQIGEVTGDVLEKTMLVTRLRTIKNEDITIPNSAILNGHTINYSSPAKETVGLILHTTITLGYDVSWKLVHQVLIEAALKIDEVKKKPKPFVLQTSLDDFYVSYQINLYTKAPEKSALIQSQLHANIQDGCNAAGIEILSPHYRAARDGNNTTIPENYLPKDYQAPSFRVKLDSKSSDD